MALITDKIFKAESEKQRVEKSIRTLDKRSPFLQWAAIPGYSRAGITWDAPSSFAIYCDGSWALAVARLRNGYDRYGPLDQHLSVRWFWVVDYHDAQGAVIFNSEYEAGVEGDKASTSNIVRNGVDHGFLNWKDRIASASGWIRYESFY